MANVAPEDVGEVILGCVLQAGQGMNVGPPGGARGGPAGQRSWRDGESRLRLRPDRGRARGRRRDRRLRRRDRGRRHRVDEQRAVPAEGRTVGLSHGPRRGHRLDGRRGAHVRDRGLPHGQHGRGDRGEVRRRSGRAGPVRGREPDAAPAQAIADGRFADEIVPVEIPQKKGAPRAGRARRVPARGHDGREARRPEGRVPEGRDGHRGQRLGHQRRRRRARGHDRRLGARARKRAARPRARVRDRRRGAEVHGHGAGARDHDEHSSAPACASIRSMSSS